MEIFINILIYIYFIFEIIASERQKKLAKYFTKPNICCDCHAPLKANEHKTHEKMWNSVT